MKKLKSGLAVGAALVACTTILGAQGSAHDSPRLARHVLDRITFGARPGDVNRVMQRGISRFINDQLHPDRLADTALNDRLQGFETLGLDSRAIAERYEIPALQARREQMQMADPPATAPNDRRPAAPDGVRMQANLPLVELSAQKVLRATYSERQLEEVLTDFWFNHFNVDARKGPVRYMLTEYERDTIRPHVLGRFRDLLGATAKSPAMLFYLDNWMSADPDGPHVDRARAARPRGGAGLGAGIRRLQRPSTAVEPAPQQAGRRPMGLNENYGRELLELHTLGVDGGYTQKDVTEVARAFTGWTIETPRMGGGFRFAPALHDDGEKVVLGHRIKAGGGEHDGEEVLDILASHPSTARFISTKLARRFVSDAPPPALIDRMAATFRKTDGDLRAVMTVLLTSPEFVAPEALHAKVKTPFEFVVSSLRATGAEVSDARPLVRTIQQLGMPLYQCQPPTGYKDDGEAWVNTGALVNRMNVALAMANGRLQGVTIPDRSDRAALLPGDASSSTIGTIARAQTASQALALTLGAPEFQRR
jgi:uncharacterized protein (DUF1800 family)